MAQRSVLEVLNVLREQLNKRGSKTIRNLGRTFRALDSFDGNRKVEYNILFDYFDRDKDGSVCFDEFLVGVRGSPNSRRQAMVDKAFLKFDRDGNGYVDANDLRGVYNCSHHPKVQRGEMTEDQAFREFLTSFNDRNRDGRVTKDEWDEYYAAVSSSIDNDDHFVQLMKTAWRLE